jgi:hypothetical protein
MSKGWVNLHGHSHGRLKPLPRQFDVGVEVWNFRSVRLTEVLGSRKAGTPKPIKILPPRMAVHILPDVLYPRATGRVPWFLSERRVSGTRTNVLRDST